MPVTPKTSLPLRWLHPESDAPPEVRTTMRQAARVEDPASRIARLEQRLLPLLGVPQIAALRELPSPDATASSAGAGNGAAAGPAAEAGTAGSVGTSGAASAGAASAGGALTTGAIAKVVAAVAIVGAVGTGLRKASESDGSRATDVVAHAKRAAAPFERALPAAVKASSRAPAAELSGAGPPTTQRSAAEPVPTRSPTPEASAHVSAVGQKRSARISTLNDEALLLSRARAVSPTNTKAALELLLEHARRFPSGALAQERELLIVELLARSGETQAAVRRLSELEAVAPNSPHLKRARASVEKGTLVEGAEK